MQVVIYGSENARAELMNKGTRPGLVLEAVSTIDSLLDYASADAFIIFSIRNTDEELKVLRQLKGLVIVDSVLNSLGEIDDSFVRINGWPGFMTSIIEASALNEELKKRAEEVFTQFYKTIEWLPDDPGFVTPRVISMIINEAYFALEEKVSTKENIDLAMKLGTAYPYGPFEWGQKIGLKNIAALLTRLTRESARYLPSALLLKEAAQA
jgi:3-hydroxybutyryl-CoA dehydrogenase